MKDADMDDRQRPRQKRNGWWGLTSNPLVILFFSAALVTWFTEARSYIDRRYERRAEILLLLGEVKFRTWKLNAIAGELETTANEKKRLALGAAARAIIQGRVTADPVYKDLHFIALLSKIDATSNMVVSRRTADVARILDVSDEVAARRLPTLGNQFDGYYGDVFKRTTNGSLPAITWGWPPPLTSSSQRPYDGDLMTILNEECHGVWDCAN